MLHTIVWGLTWICLRTFFLPIALFAACLLAISIKRYRQTLD